MKEQLLNINTRVVINDKGELELQGEITPSIRELKPNINLKKEDGWHKLSLSPDGCTEETKPDPPVGSVGTWFCFDNEWVWIPA